MPDQPTNAPMAAAPMKYLPDGSPDWSNMWDSFCALAQTGGPAHRAELLAAPRDADPSDPQYQANAREIIRGIEAVSGLGARPDEPGWIAVECPMPEMAQWVAEAIVDEHVEARHRDDVVLVPVGANFTVKGEIKSVITVVAKTTHYWADHLPPEIKQTLALQIKLGRLKRWVRARLGL